MDYMKSLLIVLILVSAPVLWAAESGDADEMMDPNPNIGEGVRPLEHAAVDVERCTDCNPFAKNNVTTYNRSHDSSVQMADSIYGSGSTSKGPSDAVKEKKGGG
jgi:hypothetical protein